MLAVYMYLNVNCLYVMQFSLISFYVLNFYPPTEPCTASQAALGYDTCMIITTAIELSFNQGMSQCELEFIILDDLSVVVPTMFIDFDTIEIWPQVGLSNNQFLLQGVDRAPDDNEKASFEGVVANYLIDTLGNDATQPILSVCVDVVDTNFIDGNGDDTTSSSAAAAVSGRSAPLMTEKKQKSPRSRGQNEPDVSTSMASEADKVESDRIDAVATASREEKVETEIIPPKHVRPRGVGEGYTVNDSTSHEDEEGKQPSKGEESIVHSHHEPRPRRLMHGISKNHRLLKKEGAVVFDTVVTGRYRGPNIDMEKKVSDVISGNEYQLVEDLEKEQPDYFVLEEEEGEKIQLTLQAPSSTSPPTSSPDIPVRVIGDGGAPTMRWRGLIGFFALGIAFVVLIVCTVNAFLRKLRGDRDDSSFSLQSILIGPPVDLESGSTAGSSTSSLSAPNMSVSSRGDSSEVGSVAVLKSILRKSEDSILKKQALFGGGGGQSTRNRVRWALGMDESSNSSKSGSTKSSSTKNSGSSSSTPGAYNVTPDSSGGVVGLLRDMWRKEGGGSSKSAVWTAEDLLDEGSDDSEVDEDDDDSSGDEEEGSSTGTPSFAQFSVYGTYLMCTQREDDGTIVTDLYGTANLCREDETITTDNRTPSTFRNSQGYFDEDE